MGVAERQSDRQTPYGESDPTQVDMQPVRRCWMDPICTSSTSCMYPGAGQVGRRGQAGRLLGMWYVGRSVDNRGNEVCRMWSSGLEDAAVTGVAAVALTPAVGFPCGGSQDGLAQEAQRGVLSRRMTDDGCTMQGIDCCLSWLRQ